MQRPVGISDPILCCSVYSRSHLAILMSENARTTRRKMHGLLAEGFFKCLLSVEIEAVWLDVFGETDVPVAVRVCAGEEPGYMFVRRPFLVGFLVLVRLRYSQPFTALDPDRERVHRTCVHAPIFTLEQ